MLSYWIVRDRNECPIGLARCDDGRVSLQLNAPLQADWTLLSDADALPFDADGEAFLADAFAVLGMREGQPVAFAAAPGAPSLACCRSRLSQIYTIITEPPATAPVPEPDEALPEPEPEPMPKMPEPSADSVPVDTVDESAERAAQFSLLLTRADAFYAQCDAPVVPADSMVQKRDMDSDEGAGIDLFPQVFPRAKWRYVDGADILPHYEGFWTGPNGLRTRILAVRGHAAPRPPRALFGFSRFLRGADGNGYWIKTE